jgi:gluconolactonase
MGLGMGTVREIEPRNLRVVASGLRFPEGPVALADGSVLVVEIAGGRLTRVAPDGTTTTVADLGGGPNGAAIGPDGAVWVTNNGGVFDWHETGSLLIPGDPPPPGWPGRGSIQRVDLATGEVGTVCTTSSAGPLLAPNDLVFDRDGGLWFTDYGARQARRIDRTGIHHLAPGATEASEVLFPLEQPNGIGLSPAGDRLYAAETFHGRLWAWTVTGPGAAHGSNPLGSAGGQLMVDPGDQVMFDSLAVDGEGWVCVGTLGPGGITAVSPDAAEVEHVPLPDPLTTNLCFGPDGRTVYVTLSATGQLAAFDWHRPGGTTAFTA